MPWIIQLLNGVLPGSGKPCQVDPLSKRVAEWDLAQNAQQGIRPITTRMDKVVATTQVGVVTRPETQSRENEPLPFW